MHIFLTLLLYQGTPAAPTLTLHASAPQPYLGQIMRLELRITFPDGTPLPTTPWQLRIPWLPRDEVGFQWLVPPEQWLCQRTQTPSPLRFRLGSHIIGAERVGNSNTFVFSWHLLLLEPDPLQPEGLRFVPVQVHDAQGRTYQSNELLLAARPLPVPPAADDALRLGVGTLALDARLEPPVVRLGQESVLTLRVRGEGTLAMLPVPVLTRLPGWQSSAFYLEGAPETWEEQGRVRCFRYRLLPRHAARELRLPPVKYFFFDPVQAAYQVRTLAMPILRVEAPPETVAPRGSPLPPEQLPQRLRFFAMDTPPLVPLTWHSPPVLAGALVPVVLLLLALIVRGGWERWRWGQATTLAGRLAWRTLRQATPESIPERIAAALTMYVQMRYGLAAAEPTYAEMAPFLQRQGLTDVLLRQVESLCQRLDDARFAPTGQPQAEQLLRAAEQLLMEWERMP